MKIGRQGAGKNIPDSSIFARKEIHVFLELLISKILFS